MEEPPKKKKPQPEYAFRASYDKEKGVKVEISPDGLDEIFEGLGGVLQNSRVGEALFGPQSQQDDEEGEELIDPFWSQKFQASADYSSVPDLSQIPVPPIKVDEDEEKSIEEVPAEPTVHVEEPQANWPPNSPYLGDDCDHPRTVKVLEPNEWFVLLNTMGYENVKMDVKDALGGKVCVKCLKKVE